MMPAASPATNNFIRVDGYGTLSRSYLHAADVAVWLRIMLVKATPGRPFNVGSSRSRSNADLTEAVRTALNPRLAREITQRPAAGQPPSAYVPSHARGLQELGLADHGDDTTATRRTARPATR